MEVKRRETEQGEIGLISSEKYEAEKTERGSTEILICSVLIHFQRCSLVLGPLIGSLWLTASAAVYLFLLSNTWVDI